MAPIINDDIEVPARLFDEGFEEDGVRLIARDYGGAYRAVGPLEGASGVEFDEIELHVGEVVEPGVVGCAGAVGLITAESDLEHLQILVSYGLEFVGVHSLVVVWIDLVCSVFFRDLVECEMSA